MSAGPPAGGTVRVGTYNLYAGADLALLFGARDAADLERRARLLRDQLAATRSAERARAVARLLSRHQPDLLGVQELTRWTAGPPESPVAVLADFGAELLEELGRSGCPYDVHAVAPGFSGSLTVAGEGLLSVTGVNAVLARRHGPVEVLAEQTGTFARVLRVPTRVPGLVFPIERGWGAVQCRVDGRGFRFVNTHLEAYDPATRDAQRDELLGRIGAGPAVLAGDFNATPDQVGMPREWLDAWAAGRGEGPGGTCGQSPDLANAESSLTQRIDYVWVRGGRALRCALVGADPGDRTAPGALWPSDHAGVLATVRW